MRQVKTYITGPPWTKSLCSTAGSASLVYLIVWGKARKVDTDVEFLISKCWQTPGRSNKILMSVGGISVLWNSYCSDHFSLMCLLLHSGANEGGVGTQHSCPPLYPRALLHRFHQTEGRYSEKKKRICTGYVLPISCSCLQNNTA